jgi:hypothetical protein
MKPFHQLFAQEFGSWARETLDEQLTHEEMLRDWIDKLKTEMREQRHADAAMRTMPTNQKRHDHPAGGPR